MKNILTFAACIVAAYTSHAQNVSKTKNFNLKGFEITLTPSAQDELYWNNLKTSVLQNDGVKKRLANTDYLVLAEEFIPSTENENYGTYQLTVFDYTKNKSLLFEYNKAISNSVKITETDEQPNSNDEEFERAIRIVLANDKALSTAYAAGSVKFYKPMPPLDLNQVTNGRIQRVLTVGIETTDPGITNEIVGANMINHSIIHYKNGVPLTSRISKVVCGVDNAAQKTTKRLKGDTYQLTIKKQGVVLWDMLVTRPRSSSGTNASGIELQNVSYLNKLALKQAHVPILNVKYDSNKCGPYRDWLYEESYFKAIGKPAGEGFVICEKRPETLFDAESDTGNFQGVAIWANDSAVSLISETEAGWYRYISEWRFFANGTILPVFEFSAVKDACVCNIHHHHVYWRFDFNIDGAANNQASEYNKGIGWKDINTEDRRINDTSLQRKWRIANTKTGDAFVLVPGDNDGTQDDIFGHGDFWVFKNNPNEIDDHVKQYTLRKYDAQIDKYLTGESTKSTDIVVWYSAHFTHNFYDEMIEHKVGPMIICTAWGATVSKTTSENKGQSKSSTKQVTAIQKHHNN